MTELVVERMRRWKKAAVLSISLAVAVAGCGGERSGSEVDELAALDTPAQACAYFTEGPEVDFEGQDVSSNLLEALRGDSWPDDGAALGAALQQATAGDLDDRDVAARIAGQAVYIIARTKAVPEEARAGVSHLLASYAPGIQRIALQRGADSNDGDWVWGDDKGEEPFAGVVGLNATATDVESVLAELGGDEDGLAVVVAALAVQRRELSAQAVAGADDKPKAVAALRFNRTAIGGLESSGRAFGVSAAFVLNNAVSGTDEDAPEQRSEILSAALIAASTHPILKPAPLTGENLTEVIDAVDAADGSDAGMDNALRAATFDILLSLGYLDTSVDPDSGVPKECVEVVADRAVRINPQLYDRDAETPAAAISDAYNAWIVDSAPVGLASVQATGTEGLAELVVR